MSHFWRIYWASVAAWLGFWAVVGGFNAIRQYQLEDGLVAALRAKDMEAAASLNSLSQMHAEWISTSLLMGVFWIIPAMAGAALGRFFFQILSRPKS